MPKSKPTTRRRARGEIPYLILRALSGASETARFTPYALASSLGLSPASATAAVKRLIEQEKVTCYGVSPLIVGRKTDDAPA